MDELGGGVIDFCQREEKSRRLGENEERINDSFEDSRNQRRWVW